MGSAHALALAPSDACFRPKQPVVEESVEQVGLGTDVAGGYSPSMLSAMRSTVIASKAVRMMHIDAARRGSITSSDASAAGDKGSEDLEQAAAAGDHLLLLQLLPDSRHASWMSKIQPGPQVQYSRHCAAPVCLKC